MLWTDDFSVSRCCHQVGRDQIWPKLENCVHASRSWPETRGPQREVPQKLKHEGTRRMSTWLHSNTAIDADACSVHIVVLDDAYNDVRHFLRSPETPWIEH
jgi:hypothetical protein